MFLASVKWQLGNAGRHRDKKKIPFNLRRVPINGVGRYQVKEFALDGVVVAKTS